MVGDRLYERHEEKALAPEAEKLERAARLRSVLTEQSLARYVVMP